MPDTLPLQAIDWEDLIPLLGEANRAIATYGGVLQGVPNPALLLSPLTTQEAVLSSRIEGTQATLGDVLRFQAGDVVQEPGRQEDIHEILNYRAALRHAVDELRTRPFTLNLLLDLHAILLDSTRGRDQGPGRIRTDQNWIGAAGTPIEMAEYVPPEPTSLMMLLGNWETYYHEDEKDLLVQLGIVHAQFEIIHPFADGNGRLGRILVPLFLYERQILPEPMFYLSAYLEKHRDEYVQRLRAITSPAGWNAWLRFFLRAVSVQAQQNARTAEAILALYDRLKQMVLNLTRSQFAVPLLDWMFDQPIFTISDLAERPGAPSRPTLHGLISALRDAGILQVVQEASGRRPQVLVLGELINLAEGRMVFPLAAGSTEAQT